MAHYKSFPFLQTFLLFLWIASNAATAFSGPSQLQFRTQSNRIFGTVLRASVSVDDPTISNFEEWFSSLSQATLNGSIRHTYFGQLRGLTWASSRENIPSGPVVSVPLSVVLQSEIGEQSSETDEWDSNLARQLWRECLLGEDSKISGYCNFLKQGLGLSEAGVPASTAPNALRHWTMEELALLQQSSAGQNLLELEKKQQDIWRTKYNRLASKSDMSYEQFQWAMEVVHSRAFRGNFGSNTSSEKDAVSSLLPTALPPLGAALAGNAYFRSTPFPDDTIFAALAVAAVLPLALNLLGSSSNPPSAVLLPMIDSANHEEDADSSIEFDPLTNCFQMSIGSKCILDSPDPGSNNPQLCISYGKRSDAELLLNYGFLPGMPCTEDLPVTEQRRRLAETFNSRN